MKQIIITFTLFLLSSQLLLAQSDSLALAQSDKLTFFDYLEKDSITEITLETDFDHLRRNKEWEELQQGHLSFKNKSGNAIQLKIGVQNRGEQRKEICQYPSIKINLPPETIEQLGLENEATYKLVCQCVGNKAYEQIVLKEYLAYKIYNILTDTSFNVHLFKINHHQTGEAESDERYGFIIETEASIARRLNSSTVGKTEKVKQPVKKETLTRLSFFQYCIGNTDWSLIPRENIKVFIPNDRPESILIPYDFDFAGLVNAPYATPNENLPIKYVTQRYFQGTESSTKEVRNSIAHFLKHEEAIMKLTADFTLLNKFSMRNVEDYLNDFFVIIKNEQQVQELFLKK